MRPASTAPSPAICAIRVPHQATKGWASPEQTRTEPMTAPDSARSPLPAARSSTAAMTARNSPAAAQARNPAAPAVAKSIRIPLGTCGRTGRQRRGCGVWSAARAATRRQAIASSTRCTRYGSTKGSDAYCASAPAPIGPAAAPATNAVLARREAWARSPPGRRWTISALAAPVTAPSAAPCATRPASSHPGPCATAKHSDPSTASTMPTRSTERRPTTSEAGPNSSRAGALTTAKVA